MKYSEWLNFWLENYIKPSVKQKTYLRYKEIAQKQIEKRFDAYALDELTPMIFQQFVTELLTSGNAKTGDGLSASTVNVVITVIQNSLQIAYNLGYIQNEIGGKIKRPKLKEKQVSCFTVAEQKLIEQEIMKSNKPKMKGILICLYTGLRIGELLALEWTDVDLVKGDLSVTNTCFDGKDKNGVFCRITNAPKTDTSVRVIPIPKQLMPILKNMKKIAKNQYVISDSEKTLAVRSYQRSFERLLKSLASRTADFIRFVIPLPRAPWRSAWM